MLCSTNDNVIDSDLNETWYAGVFEIADSENDIRKNKIKKITITKWLVVWIKVKFTF